MPLAPAAAAISAIACDLAARESARRRRAVPARAERTLPSAARRRRGSRVLHHRRRARSAGRAEARHCPSRADRRARASRCESVRVAQAAGQCEGTNAGRILPISGGDSLGSGQCEQRTQAFASGEQAVAHRFPDEERLAAGCRDPSVQGGVDFTPAAFEPRMEFSARRCSPSTIALVVGAEAHRCRR